MLASQNVYTTFFDISSKRPFPPIVKSWVIPRSIKLGGRGICKPLKGYLVGVAAWPRYMKHQPLLHRRQGHCFSTNRRPSWFTAVLQKVRYMNTYMKTNIWICITLHHRFTGAPLPDITFYQRFHRSPMKMILTALQSFFSVCNCIPFLRCH